MACLDLVKETSEEGTKPFIDQVGQLEGENTIVKAEVLGVGTTKYNLINIDGEPGNPGSFIRISYGIVLLILLSFI